MGRRESLLAAVVTEDAGRFDATLQTTEELLERLALAGDHVHTRSLSFVGARLGALAGAITKRADRRRPASVVFQVDHDPEVSTIRG